MFLGTFGYSITSDAGVTSCDTTNSNWDTCADTTNMIFDAGLCSANVAYTGKIEFSLIQISILDY